MAGLEFIDVLILIKMINSNENLIMIPFFYRSFKNLMNNQLQTVVIFGCLMNVYVRILIKSDSDRHNYKIETFEYFKLNWAKFI